MAGIVFPNIGNALLPLIQMDRQQEESRLNRERMDRHDQLLLDDRKDARELQRMQVFQGLDDKKRAKAKEEFEIAAKTTAGILSLPEAEQPAAYEAAHQALTAQGYSLNLPPRWSPDIKPRLQAFAVQVPKYLEMLGGQPQAMPPVGGGAPAPGGPPGDVLARSGNAISGIESAGQPNNGYGAIGPVAKSNGARAYGKYQVMDFNIPTWTAEVLGKPMSPQEFLADTQAQDAVFKAKFGQLVQKYGPEGASRAWFAGEGGMNNPNAADVNGMTVAKYGQKFNAGFGGPQVAQAGGPPVVPPQGGGEGPGQGDVMTPPRAAPPAIGNEVDEIRKQTRASGGDIFTVKGQVEIQNGNYVVRSIQNPRQIVGMIPVKSKESGPSGPFAGNNPDVQAFNYLVSTGKMTVEQAANVLGGKTVTNPADGSIVFMPASALAGAGGPPAAAPSAASPPTGPSGAVQLTPAKKDPAFKKLETEIRAVESAVNNFQKVIAEAGGGSWRAFVNDPTSPDAQKVLGAFNAMKTALRSEAFINTGVLQPAEMTMIDDMLLSPQSIRGAMATPEAYGAMLGQVLTYVRNKHDAAAAAYGQSAPPSAAPAPAGPPKVGDTQDGYLFKGGDPSQPSSWEKVR
ncbi:MAG: hypothetical protein K0R61_62 [Microvirga sp.]|jgi:hypothetical protein|nr:hypothetical protein [Microvirga sp.]MDF2969612.1 hypothetical protein [Microvirga sp.]